jgi:hypothetical protein
MKISSKDMIKKMKQPPSLIKDLFWNAEWMSMTQQ